MLAAHPKAKNLPIFEKGTITKNDLHEFFLLIEPFRKSIKILEGFHQSNGHLMAMELHDILVYYVNYMADLNNPKMMRGFAGQFVKQCEDYFDGVQAQNGGYKKLKRIDSIRLLQVAFYIPSNILNHFNPNCHGPVLDENKKKSIYERYTRLNNELNSLIANYDAQNDAQTSLNSSNSSLMMQSFSKTPLEMEVFMFSSLAGKYAPGPIREFMPQCMHKQHNFLNFKKSNLLRNLEIVKLI